MRSANKSRIRRLVIDARVSKEVTDVVDKQYSTIGYALPSGTFVSFNHVRGTKFWEYLARTIGNRRTLAQRRSIVATISSVKP